MIIAGLGNPGQKYSDTWHNIGFLVLDRSGQKNNFPDFKFSKKFNAEISESIFNNEKVILAKPQTFMNKSGQAVKKIIGNWKLEIGNSVVVHDDIDIPLGKIRISKGQGPAGHKGVEDIIRNLNTKEFIRIRVGILPKKGKPENVEKFVLQKFTKKEKEIIENQIKKAALALDLLIKEGAEKAMNEYNE